MVMPTELKPFTDLAAIVRTQKEILGLDSGVEELAPEHVGCEETHALRVDTCCGPFFLCEDCGRRLVLIMSVTGMLVMLGTVAIDTCPACAKELHACWKPTDLRT